MYRIRVLLRLLVVVAWMAQVALADVTWGVDEGGSWLDPSNWSENRLPTRHDSVIISRPLAIETELSDGSVEIDRLITDEALRLTRAALTIHGASTVTAPLELQQSELSVLGPSGHLTTGSRVTATNAEFNVRDGGVLSLAGLESLDIDNPNGFVQWASYGDGSQIQVPSLTRVTANLTECSCGFQAIAAQVGVIQMENLESIVSESQSGRPLVVWRVSEGGRVELPSLQTATGVSLRSFKDGNLNVPSLTNFRNGEINVALGSTFDSDLTNADGSQLIARDAATIRLSHLTDYDLGGSRATFSSHGRGTLLDLSSLRSLKPGAAVVPTLSQLTIGASQGGRIDLSRLTEISRSEDSGAVRIVATGDDAVVDISSLPTTNGITSISVADGGFVSWVPATRIDGTEIEIEGDAARLDIEQTLELSNGAFSVDATSRRLPQLRELTNSALNAHSGGQLLVPILAHASNVSLSVSSRGHLELASLTEVAADELSNGPLRLNASGGGRLDATRLSSINSSTRRYRLDASGRDSHLSLPSLSNLAGVESIGVRAGGTIQLGPVAELEDVDVWVHGGNLLGWTEDLRSFSGGNLSIHNSQVVLPRLSGFDSASIDLADAATFSAPQLHSYRASRAKANRVSWKADGAGSIVDLSNLADIETDAVTFRIDASNGGRVDLSGLQRFSSIESEVYPVRLSARGAGSAIDVSSLTDVSNIDEILVSSGGRLDWTSPTHVSELRLSLFRDTQVEVEQFESIVRSELTLGDTQLTLPNLTNFDGSHIALSSAGLSLPSLRSVRVGPAGHGRGWDMVRSTLSLPALESIDLRGDWLVIASRVGSDVDLASLSQVINSQPGDGQLRLRSTGADSVLRIPSLIYAEDVIMDWRDGEIVMTDEVATFHRSSIYSSERGGRLTIGTIQLAEGSELFGIGSVGGSVQNTAGVISPGFQSERVRFDTDTPIREDTGILRLEGDLLQSNGEVLIHVAGTTPGSDVDQLEVGGTATLGGKLRLVARSDAQLKLGDRFAPVVARSIEGKFDAVESSTFGPAAGGPMAFAVTYDRDRVNVRMSIVGDVNFDDVFDSRDLTVVFQAGRYESAINDATWRSGDWNGDGRFSTSDLTLAFQHGRFVAGRPVAGVPEPPGCLRASVARSLSRPLRPKTLSSQLDLNQQDEGEALVPISRDVPTTFALRSMYAISESQTCADWRVAVKQKDFQRMWIRVSLVQLGQFHKRRAIRIEKAGGT